MRKALRSIGLFALLIGPFSMFFILSKGEHEFQKLPFLFEGNSTGSPAFYNNLTFTTSVNDTMSFSALKGKIIIVSCFAASCPNHCPVDPKMMKFQLFDQILETKGFKDVVMISECEGSDSAASFMQQTLEVTSNRWFFVSMPAGKSFFNIQLNKNNPYKMKDPDGVSNRAYQHSILLIDKEQRVRGFYNAAKSIEYKRVMQELRLLKKQYAKEKEKLKVNSEQ
ncbi:MAG: hypothetical protein ACHQF2_07740 [Flavobacteriales bacterium]